MSGRIASLRFDNDLRRRAEIPDSVFQEVAEQIVAETHGNAAYLADNLAAVTIERDEFAAEVEQLRAELDRYRRCPACQQTQP